VQLRRGSVPGQEKSGIVSPFTLISDTTWHSACQLFDIPDGRVLPIRVEGENLLLFRRANVVSCFRDECAHLGLPIHDGDIREGILTCPHHGFRYDLTNGSCLTAPDVRLRGDAVRVVAGQVEVNLSK